MSRFVAIGAAVGIAFAGAAVSLTAATPAPSTEIAYVGKIPRLKTYALYTIDTDGSGRRLITPYGHVTRATSISWSPDGKQLAFARGQENYGQIVVVNVDGSGVKRLTASSLGSANPSFSPDGRLIAFNREDANGNRQIWVMNADGTGKRKLTRSKQLNASPVWSPDGSEILFERYFGGSRMELYTVDADGGGTRKIARVRTSTSNGRYYCACPAWSPDRTKIAYEAVTENGKPSIFVMNADGSGRTRLTHLGRTREENPDWSPDGTQIAFYSERFGNAEIVVMDADGTHQRRITHDPWYDCCPRWKPASGPG